MTMDPVPCDDDESRFLPHAGKVVDDDDGEESVVEYARRYEYVAALLAG